MFISLLAILVVVETLVIMIVLIAFLGRRSSKLKRRINELIENHSDVSFHDLVKEEIEKTKGRIIEPASDLLDLADTSDIPDEQQPLMATTETTADRSKELLAFRSQYLQAEKNAIDSSDGDPDMFWLYLAENLESLMPVPQSSSDEVQSNDFTNNTPVTDEDQQQNGKGTTARESVFFIENTHRSINTEVNKLKDIIFDQGNQINSLLAKLKASVDQGNIPDDITDMLAAFEQSQKETSMCMEVLEMENQRLSSQIDSLHAQLETGDQGHTLEDINIDGVQLDDMNPDQLKKQIIEFKQTIESQQQQYNQLQKEFDSVQKEFIAIYEKRNQNK